MPICIGIIKRLISVLPVNRVSIVCVKSKSEGLKTTERVGIPNSLPYDVVGLEIKEWRAGSKLRRPERKGVDGSVLSVCSEIVLRNFFNGRGLSTA